MKVAIINDLAATARFEPNPANFDGFVRSKNARLIDGNGSDLLLRGVGLGNWMLPEGYMWRFGPGAESPREIERLVDRLLGTTGAEQFWDGFRTNFISERDIALIAASGFNHVRLPINSRVIQDESGEPIEAGYAMIDRLIEWCRTHKLWVLLDLHGAPGGQTGTNIDDSPRNLPELFLEPRYRELTVRLWRDLATRYCGETVVLGYDLLNEPLPNEWQHSHGDALVDLYSGLTTEIREIEGGENTLEWLYTAFRLYETHDIGWNLWPWKKIDTRTSPASIVPPTGWDTVVASIQDPSAISRGQAERVFTDLVENMKIDNCHWQPDVVAALLAVTPAVIPAWGYGFRGAGVSYSVATPGGMEGIRVQDTVPLRWARNGENPANPFEQTDGRAYQPAEEMVVDLEAGDWVEYEITGATNARVVDGEGSDSAVSVDRTTRGIRITATSPTTISRIYPFCGDQT